MNTAQDILSVIRGWIGKNEKDGSHKEIIDLYNSITPLPAGYRMTYKDAWCAATISAAAAAAGMTSTVLTECSCNRMIKLYQQRGLWKSTTYDPRPGDIIFYSWKLNGSSDHVGIIEDVQGNNLTTIEGNYQDAVGRRHIPKSYKYIMGYGTPRYSETGDLIIQPDHHDFSAEEFLSIIKHQVIEDGKKTGILPSLTAAQALIESGRGNSTLSRMYNNLFGMKKSTDWRGDTISLPTTEYINGQRQTVIADFKVYKSWTDSIHDHSQLFLKYDRYKNLIGERDYKAACQKVADDGYATSPTYPQTLTGTIERYDLKSWDSEQPASIPQTGNYNIKGYSLKDLRYGDTGEHVRLLQQLLLAYGYGLGTSGADGEYGPLTERAILLYKADNHISSVNYEMWNKLIR